MSASVEYQLNQASEAHILEHLLCCNANFVPVLSDRLDINDYAKKIASKAIRFEAWSGEMLVGLVAAYCNDHKTHIAYITSVSVLKAWTGKGIAARLMSQCAEQAKALGMRQISLEVASDNMPAIELYKKSGFVSDRTNVSFVSMILYLKSVN